MSKKTAGLSDPTIVRTQGALCVVLKATEAGGYIAHHLPQITKMINGSGFELDMGRTGGECHVVLPHHYCAIRAQALAERLNSLTDERGRNLLEAEVYDRPALLTRRRPGFSPA